MELAGELKAHLAGVENRIEKIKSRIVDDAEGRRQLTERFRLSQKYSQKDPWAERGWGGKEAKEFTPLMRIGGKANCIFSRRAAELGSLMTIARNCAPPCRGWSIC